MMKGINRVFLVIFFCLSTVVYAEKKVLVIESYHAEYPWDKSYLEGLRETFGDEVLIDTFQMDTKRVPQSEYQAKADLAWQHFQNTKPDLVILGDDNALNFLVKKIDATGTPVVFLGINGNPRDLEIGGDIKNATGILERPLFKRSIAELRELMGGKLNSLLVLFDSGNTSKIAVSEYFEGKSDMNISGTRVVLELVGKEERWHEVIASAEGKYDAIVVGLYQTLTNAKGVHIDAESILSWTSKNSKVPLFAFWDFTVGKGKAIGGLVLFGKVQGQEAAKVAQRIFAGEHPSTILPSIAFKGQYYFSESELARWNLTLPEKIRDRATLIE